MKSFSNYVASACLLGGMGFASGVQAELPDYQFIRDLSGQDLTLIVNGEIARVPTDINNDGVVMAMSRINDDGVEPRLWLYDAVGDQFIASGIEGITPGFSFIQQNNMASENHYLIGVSGVNGAEFQRCRIDTIAIDPVTGVPAGSDCLSLGALQISSPPWSQAQMNDTGWALHYTADNPLISISSITLTDPNGTSYQLDISDIPVGTTRYVAPVLTDGDAPKVYVSFLTGYGSQTETESTTLREYAYDGANWLAQDYSVPTRLMAIGANDGYVLMNKWQASGNDYSYFSCQPAIDQCANPDVIIDGTSTIYASLDGLSTDALLYYGELDYQGNNAYFSTHLLYDLAAAPSSQPLDLQALLNSVPGYESATMYGLVRSPDSSELLIVDTVGNVLYFSTDPTQYGGYDVTLTFDPPGQTRPYVDELIANAELSNGVGPVQYRFIIRERIQGASNPEVFNSGWQAQSYLSINTLSLGLLQNKDYIVIVRARDTGNGNEVVVSQKRLNLR